MNGLKQRISRLKPHLSRLKPRLPRRGAAGPQVKRPDLPAGSDEQTAIPAAPGFRERGRLRRRLRYLRRARELGFRDLGGLAFDLRRFGRDRPDLVEAKLGAIAAADRELRALEIVLDDKRSLHELREPGISSCARCGALHSSDANFCPHCGLQLSGPRAMGEIGGAIAAPPQAPPDPAGGEAAPPPADTATQVLPATPPDEQGTQGLESQRTSDRGS